MSWISYHCDDDTAEKIFEENYAYKNEKYNTASPKKNNDDIAEQVFEEANPFKGEKNNDVEIKPVKDEQRQENSHRFKTSAIFTAIFTVLYYIIPQTDFSCRRLRAFLVIFIILCVCGMVYSVFSDFMLQLNTNENDE